LEHRGEILDPTGRFVAMGACLDLSDHGFWQDKELREGSQEIETVDAGESARSSSCHPLEASLAL
jgi:hypothetical protein